MLNDSDDKHDDHEESEYHFSDEDISYEAESEPPKASTAGRSSSEGLVNRVSSSRRLMISAGVFLVLVYIVYKMVAPSSSSVAPADINASIVAAASQQNAAKVKAPTMPQQMPQTQAPTQQVAATEAAPQMAPAQAVQPPPAPPTQMAPTQPPAQPMAAAGQPAQQPNQAIAPPQQAAPAQVAQAPQGMVNMPAVIAVQAPATQPTQATQPMQETQAMQPVQPTQAMQQLPPPPAPSNMPASSPTVTIVQSPPEVESKIASMEATNEKLMGQLQTEYSQKLNDYSVQNKALQDQVQALNSRMAGMESQLNHLVQALTRSGQPSSNSIDVVPGRHFPPTGPESKIAYSVQAIIPGRAWLRSDNGEAITVAEGDAIKSLGRVVKIDPYDGVVEINTGNRVVSLSYGNGGESS